MTLLAVRESRGWSDGENAGKETMPDGNKRTIQIFAAVVWIVSFYSIITLYFVFIKIGWHVLAVIVLLLIPVPLGLYMMFGKYVFFFSEDLSKSEGKIVLGLFLALIVPMIGTCTIAVNGGFERAVQEQAEAKTVQDNPELKLSPPDSPSENIRWAEYSSINFNYRAIILWWDKRPNWSRSGSQDEFDAEKSELLDGLNSVINNPDTSAGTAEVAAQMREQVEKRQWQDMVALARDRLPQSKRKKEKAALAGLEERYSQYLENSGVFSTEDEWAFRREEDRLLRAIDDLSGKKVKDNDVRLLARQLRYDMTQTRDARQN